MIGPLNIILALHSGYTHSLILRVDFSNYMLCRMALVLISQDLNSKIYTLFK